MIWLTLTHEWLPEFLCPDFRLVWPIPIPAEVTPRIPQSHQFDSGQVFDVQNGVGVTGAETHTLVLGVVDLKLKKSSDKVISDKVTFGKVTLGNNKVTTE